MCLSPEVRHDILNQSNVTTAISILADGYERSDGVVTMVQIGACNGNIENDHVQDILKAREFMRGYLVEAVDWLYHDLVKVMEPYEGRISCYNVAIGSDDGYRMFYSAAKRLGTEQPYRLEWKLYQLGSFRRENLSVHLPGEYIDSNRVQCLSPKSFMREAEIDPKQLDLLIVDAEGADDEIVIGFLEVSLPQMIVYEHKILSEGVNNIVLRELEARGYRHRQIGDDILAIR